MTVTNRLRVHFDVILIVRTAHCNVYYFVYVVVYVETAVKEEYTAPAVSEGTPEQVRRRRHWELWSAQDKNLFFEGLFEASFISLYVFFLYFC